MNVKTKNFQGLSGKLFKCLPVFIILWLLGNPLMAQFKEVGGGIGTMNYLGDLPYKLTWHQPAVNLFYRTNFSPSTSLRYSLTIGRVKANVADTTALPQTIEPDMVGFTYIGEAAATFEYNFLNYSRTKSGFRFTPYLFGGVGAFYMQGPASSGVSNLQPVIPFGVGFKQMLGKQWNLGFEAGMRKTFTDFLDDYSTNTDAPKDFHGNTYTKDYYYFVGVNLSYTFFDVLCP